MKAIYRKGNQKMTQRIDQETGEVYETTEGGEVVQFNPNAVQLVPGMNLNVSAMSFSQKLKAIREVSKFIGGVALEADNFTNMKLEVCGCMQHGVAVRDAEGVLVPAVRTVIMVSRAGDQVFQDPVKVKFVSIAATHYFRSFILPLFGAGMWEESIPMKITRVKLSSGVGSTFAFEVPGLDEVNPGGTAKRNKHEVHVSEEAPTE